MPFEDVFSISTFRYKLICSVIKIETLRYLAFIAVPSVINRKIKQPNEHDQKNTSISYCQCWRTESFSDSAHRNETNTMLNIKVAETMTSTDRCGPRFCNYCCDKKWEKSKKKITETHTLPSNKIEHLAKFLYSVVCSTENVVLPTFWLVSTMLNVKIISHITA